MFSIYKQVPVYGLRFVVWYKSATERTPSQTRWEGILTTPTYKETTGLENFDMVPQYIERVE